MQGQEELHAGQGGAAAEAEATEAQLALSTYNTNRDGRVSDDSHMT